MKTVLLFLFLSCNVLAKAQNNAGSGTSRIDTIHSVILNEDRYIWVHQPQNATRISTYPVVYILDGQVFFDDVNKILDSLSKETGKNVANEMIVVGIGNIWQRYRDYSPTHINSSPWVDSHTASTTGGGIKFTSFLDKELFPYIESKYPASATRLLIGYSMGGLLAMHILIHHPDLFTYYAVIDPSMWWDNQKLLNETKTILATKTFEKNTLFLAIANTKELNMDVRQIENDTSEKTVLIRPSLKLVEYINYNRKNKLLFDWKFYSKFNHITVPAPAICDALKFFLKSL